METINKNEFIDIYVSKTLNEIKRNIKLEIDLDKDKEEEIDRKMSLVLKDLINANFKNLQMDPKGNIIYTFLPIVDEQENKKIRMLLALYYTALYYDNVELLQDLLKENVNFKCNYTINLQYLDKTISSKFERKKYIEMIKICGDIFKNFVVSIKNLSDEEREKYIKRFVKLINIKYELIRNSILSRTINYWDRDRFGSVFNKNNLDTFTDETYIKATKEQLNFIDSCKSDCYKKETCERLNNLMQTRNFSNYLYNFDLMMSLYTDEQIETLDYLVSHVINKFSKTDESLNKIIDFIQRRPDLVRRLIGFEREDFIKIDNITLIEMLDKYKFINTMHDNVYLMAKAVQPKVALKKMLGFYKKDELKNLDGPVLLKK